MPDAHPVTAGIASKCVTTSKYPVPSVTDEDLHIYPLDDLSAARLTSNAHGGLRHQKGHEARRALTHTSGKGDTPLNRKYP